MALNPKVVTYRDLVMTSPNTRSDQAKSEREPLAPLQGEEYTIAGSHGWPTGNLEDGCLKKADSTKMKEAVQSGRDKIKAI